MRSEILWLRTSTWGPVRLWWMMGKTKQTAFLNFGAHETHDPSRLDFSLSLYKGFLDTTHGCIDVFSETARFVVSVAWGKEVLQLVTVLTISSHFVTGATHFVLSERFQLLILNKTHSRNLYIN